MRRLIFAFLIAAFATVPAVAQDDEKPAQEEVKAAKAEKEYKPPPGYKTRHRGDKTIYCRKGTEIGSRFKVEKCFSKDQLKLELERIETEKEEFERSRRQCVTAKVCANP